MLAEVSGVSPMIIIQLPAVDRSQADIPFAVTRLYLGLRCAFRGRSNGFSDCEALSTFQKGPRPQVVTPEVQTQVRQAIDKLDVDPLLVAFIFESLIRHWRPER